VSDKRKSQLERDTETLYDYAVARPGGFTYADVYKDLQWERSRLIRTARQVRLLFHDDTVNLICDPQGFRQPWLYRLVGNYDDARPWSANRAGDLEARLITMLAVAETTVHTTDGRTALGKRARLIHSTLGNLVVQLDTIDAASG
jgi:phosphoribosylformylglycinamidine (FGAM) synthase-like amidotransferase family enzyme